MIVQNMTGKVAGKFSFKRSMQVVRMSEKADVTVFGEGVHIDTQLLFQRLTTAADRNVDDISEVFKYELSSIPSSLFDNAGLGRHKNLHLQMLCGNKVIVATVKTILTMRTSRQLTLLMVDLSCSVFNG